MQLFSLANASNAEVRKWAVADVSGIDWLNSIECAQMIEKKQHKPGDTGSTDVQSE